jgi:hypothetical protein
VQSGRMDVSLARMLSSRYKNMYIMEFYNILKNPFVCIDFVL